MLLRKYLSSLIFFLGLTVVGQAQIDYPALSGKLLQAIREGHQERIEEINQQLARVSPEKLAAGLNNDEKRLTFWINSYNSHILLALKEHPERYQNRSQFFSEPRISLAGQSLSFDDIEHGILRHSKLKLSLGFIENPFPGDLEEMMRVDRVDWRIHFALNCGAASCPPLEVYAEESLYERLNDRAYQYLKHSTRFLPKKDKVQVTSLMSWFRGDFGNLTGIKELLKSYSLVPQAADPAIEFLPYDWTLDLDNWSDELEARQALPSS